MAKRPASTPAPEERPLDASCRVVVLHGEETFLRHLYTQALREDLARRFGTIDVVAFDGSAASAADVLDECRSFGLIATHKLVLVEHAEQLVREDDRPKFERYVQALIDAGEGRPGAWEGATATLVLRADGWRPGNLDKLVARVGVVQRCEPLPEEKAIAWALTRCRKQHGAEIERPAAELLVARVGADLARIDSELGKLASASDRDASGKPAPIDAALVARFVGHSREEEVWSIQHRYLGATPERALGALRESLEVSRHPTALVFFALTDLARKMHALSRATRQGMNAFQLRGPLKLWGASGEALATGARGTPPERAKRILDACLEGTTRDRSGLGEASRTLERIVLEFARPD